MRKVGGITAVAIILVALAICAFAIIYFNPFTPSSKSGQSETLSAPLEIIEITAAQLYQEYDDNEVRADLKYEDKILRATGIVTNIGEDIMGNPYIVIAGDEDIWWGVQCTYPNTTKYRTLLAEFHTGDTVTVTGVCNGFLFNVLLECR